MSKGSGTLRWPVGVTTGAVEKTLGLTFPEGVLALGALEEPDAIVGNEVEDEVENKRFAKLTRVCMQMKNSESKVA